MCSYGYGLAYMFSFSEYLIKIYGSTHMARVAFLLFKKLCSDNVPKLPSYQLATLVTLAHSSKPPRSSCLSAGVENRERARSCLIKVRRASDFPSEIFSQGKFRVRREA